jgi:signal transduction histidine kinase
MLHSGRMRALIDGSGLLSVLPVGVFACAPSGEILFFNDRAADLWGRTPERFEPLERFSGAFRLLRRDGTMLLPEETPMAVALNTGMSIEGVETILERPDGSRVRCHSHIRVEHDELGIAIGAVEVFHQRVVVPFDRLRNTEPLLEMVRVLTAELSGLVDLASIAHDVAMRYAPRALERDTTIYVDADEPVHAIGNHRQLNDAIAHMVENALRFGQGSRVDVRVLRTPPSAELSVSRHGHGATFTMSLPLAS